jgi:hypothetical protein
VSSGAFAGTDESADRLSVICAALLEHVVACYAALNVTAPTRQYVSPGTPAVDAEQLVVFLGRIYTGTPGQEVAGPMCVPQRVSEIVVQVHRCTPTVDDSGQPPSVGALGAAGSQFAQDAWVLRRACEQFTHEGIDAKGLGALVELEPAGGFAGMEQPVGVTLP